MYFLSNSFGTQVLKIGTIFSLGHLVPGIFRFYEVLVGILMQIWFMPPRHFIKHYIDIEN